MPTGECANHGNEGECSRCGTFICGQCRRWSRERPYCEECHRRIGHKPSARATASLVLSTVGLGMLLPGILGGALGWLELRAIRRGAAPPAGESFARVAMVLGALETLALVVWLVHSFAG